MNVSETSVNMLIADSQFLITESLKFLLHWEGHFRLIKVVSEKNELIKALEHENISLLIIDHSLIDIGSISELKEIILRFPELKVLVISNNISKPDLHDLNSAGILDIILKTAGSE